mmetsp:Transcript_118811/g.331455  ORF Transcript_118811/g.331455 Transcript_118811/m.331455 type:complete len:383 (+) Transcript_118811:521-1669(+)
MTSLQAASLRTNWRSFSATMKACSPSASSVVASSLLISGPALSALGLPCSSTSTATFLRSMSRARTGTLAATSGTATKTFASRGARSTGGCGADCRRSTAKLAASTSPAPSLSIAPTIRRSRSGGAPRAATWGSTPAASSPPFDLAPRRKARAATLVSMSSSVHLAAVGTLPAKEHWRSCFDTGSLCVCHSLTAMLSSSWPMRSVPPAQVVAPWSASAVRRTRRRPWRAARRTKRMSSTASMLRSVSTAVAIGGRRPLVTRNPTTPPTPPIASSRLPSTSVRWHRCHRALGGGLGATSLAVAAPVAAGSDHKAGARRAGRMELLVPAPAAAAAAPGRRQPPGIVPPCQAKGLPLRVGAKGGCCRGAIPDRATPDHGLQGRTT